MRMWNISLNLLCDKHLIGVHGEIHKFKASFEKKHSIKGRIGQIEPLKMQELHDKTAEEMIRRGFNHRSPYSMPNLYYLGDLKFIKTDKSRDFLDLYSRCEKCRKMLNKDLKIIKLK